MTVFSVKCWQPNCPELWNYPGNIANIFNKSSKLVQYPYHERTKPITPRVWSQLAFATVDRQAVLPLYLPSSFSGRAPWRPKSPSFWLHPPWTISCMLSLRKTMEYSQANESRGKIFVNPASYFHRCYTKQIFIQNSPDSKRSVNNTSTTVLNPCHYFLILTSRSSSIPLSIFSNLKSSTIPEYNVLIFITSSHYRRVSLCPNIQQETRKWY